MTDHTPADAPTLDIRKYPNRRYYDATHSRHVTLEEIHRLIRDGHNIRVTDSRTGEDLTGKVLTQVLMEQDPLKLDIFPNDLLHTLIRSNEQLVSDFVEKYFNQALGAFLHSQKQFEAYLRNVVGLHGRPGAGAPAANPFMNPFLHHFMAPPAPPAPPPAAEPDTTAELRQMVDELRQQVAELKDARPKA